ncbi:hypothetical protein [Burkholderia ubonensis]|nr:hypothetical protein [Burkholderia ubonensis]
MDQTFVRDATAARRETDTLPVLQLGLRPFHAGGALSGRAD